MELLAQIIGLVAMVANITSYQFKNNRTVMLFQMVGGGLFAINMFMLDASMGCILNILAVLRAISYILSDKRKWNKNLLNWIFSAAYVISYVLVFTVFSKTPTAENLIMEALPTIGMIVMNFGFSKGNAKAIRLCSFVTSPCWLVYNCINFAIGGIICEAVSLVSSITAFIRLDIKKTA